MMKEFCFGLAIGAIMGMLVATNSNKVNKALQQVEKMGTKTVNQVKQKLCKDCNNQTEEE